MYWHEWRIPKPLFSTSPTSRNRSRAWPLPTVRTSPKGPALAKRLASLAAETAEVKFLLRILSLQTLRWEEIWHAYKNTSVVVLWNAKQVSKVKMDNFEHFCYEKWSWQLWKPQLLVGKRAFTDKLSTFFSTMSFPVLFNLFFFFRPRMLGARRLRWHYHWWGPPGKGHWMSGK